MDLSETVDVSAELDHLLSTCGSKLQDYYRLSATGKSQTEIAKELGAYQPNVSVALAKIRIIRNGPQEGRDSTANLTAATAAIRSLLKHQVSNDLREYLEQVIDSCNNLLTVDESVEDAAIQHDSENLEEELTVRSASGVYVFTTPSYRKLGWFKVGQTKNSAWDRIRNQIRQAGGYPDGVEILRVYLSEDPLGTEQRFHRLLDGAQHPRSSAELAGTEWFQTNLRFLDMIAELMGLKTLTGEE